MTTSKKDTEFRCKKCDKLLALADAHNIEIKCTRCGTFNSILEKMDEQVVITDPNGIILFTNSALERITGYTLKEVVGKNPSIWGGQMSKDFYQAMWHTIKVEKQSVRVRLKNVRKDGTEYVADLRISPVLDINGEVKFFVGIETLVT